MQPFKILYSRTHRQVRRSTMPAYHTLQPDSIILRTGPRQRTSMNNTQLLAWKSDTFHQMSEVMSETPTHHWSNPSTVSRTLTPLTRIWYQDQTPSWRTISGTTRRQGPYHGIFRTRSSVTRCRANGKIPTSTQQRLPTAWLTSRHPLSLLWILSRTIQSTSRLSVHSGLHGTPACGVRSDPIPPWALVLPHGGILVYQLNYPYNFDQFL